MIVRCRYALSAIDSHIVGKFGVLDFDGISGGLAIVGITADNKACETVLDCHAIQQHTVFVDSRCFCVRGCAGNVDRPELRLFDFNTVFIESGRRHGSKF